MKIIQYHGWNDQTLQPGNSPNYYERVTAAMGGQANTRDFYRLFMVPGMTHCYFGAGASSFGGVGEICVKASRNIELQNGHPVATVAAPVDASCSARSMFTRSLVMCRTPT